MMLNIILQKLPSNHGEVSVMIIVGYRGSTLHGHGSMMIWADKSW